MKTRVGGPLLAVSLLLLGACGDTGNEEIKDGAAAPNAGPAAAPEVQLPSSAEIEAEAAVAPEDAEDAFEQLKREIEADS